MRIRFVPGLKLGDDAEKRMERLGVLQAARDGVEFYTRIAIERLDSIPGDKAELTQLITAMGERVH